MDIQIFSWTVHKIIYYLSLVLLEGKDLLLYPVIFPSVTMIGTKIIIFWNLMVIVQCRPVKYWSKNWQTWKLLSSSSTTIFLRIAAKKQNVTEATFLSQRGLFMIFVMERTFLSWKGQYFFVCEIEVNKEKLSEKSIISLHTRATIYSCKTCTLSVC